MAYYPHNVHFLWFAASADGQSRVALEAARKVAGGVPDAQLAELPLLAGFRVVPYWALLRFGRWQEVLKEPEPPAGSAFLRGAWHYARGQALVATGDPDAAARELEAIEALLPDKSLDQPLFSFGQGFVTQSAGFIGNGNPLDIELFTHPGNPHLSTLGENCK
jgi:hypothetical protein